MKFKINEAYDLSLNDRFFKDTSWIDELRDRLQYLDQEDLEVEYNEDPVVKFIIDKAREQYPDDIDYVGIIHDFINYTEEFMFCSNAEDRAAFNKLLEEDPSMVQFFELYTKDYPNWDKIEESLTEGLYTYQTWVRPIPGEKQPSKTLTYGSHVVLKRSPYSREEFGSDWKRHVNKIIEWCQENNPGLIRMTHDFRLTNFPSNPNSEEAFIAAIEDKIDSGEYLLKEALTESINPQETVDIEYKDYIVTSDEDDDLVVNWTYAVPKKDLYLYIWEMCIDEEDFPRGFEDSFDPNNESDWDEFTSWLDSNFDTIYNKYQEGILEEYADEAIEEYIEKNFGDAYIDWDSMPGGHDDYDINESKEENICCICKKPFEGYGNNAEPVCSGSCCDKCNIERVIPMRFKMIQDIDEGYRKDPKVFDFNINDRVAERWNDGEFNVGTVIDIKEEDGKQYLIKWDYSDGPSEEWLYGDVLTNWIEEIDESLNEGNSVSSKIPPALDSFLQDITQMYGTIDYGNIMDHDYTEDDIRKLNNLRRRFITWAQYDEDDEEVKAKLNEIANKVAEILKRVDEGFDKQIADVKEKIDYYNNQLKLCRDDADRKDIERKLQGFYNQLNYYTELDKNGGNLKMDSLELTTEELKDDFDIELNEDRDEVAGQMSFFDDDMDFDNSMEEGIKDFAKKIFRKKEEPKEEPKKQRWGLIDGQYGTVSYSFDTKEEAEAAWRRKPMSQQIRFRVGPIEESLHESTGQYILFGFNHFSPDDLWMIKDSRENLEDLISTYGEGPLQYNEIIEDKGNLLFVEHNDELISVQDTGYKTIDEVKKALYDVLDPMIQADLESGEETGEYEFDVAPYFLYIDELTTTQDAVDYAMDLIENSYVDGDSNSEYRFVDPATITDTAEDAREGLGEPGSEEWDDSWEDQDFDEYEESLNNSREVRMLETLYKGTSSMDTSYDDEI